MYLFPKKYLIKSAPQMQRYKENYLQKALQLFAIF